MFGEISKLLDRNFAIGFALPSAFFLSITMGLLQAFGIYSLPQSLKDSNPIVGTTTIALVAWAGGVVLNALSLTIMRILEGYYGRLNPFTYLKPIQVRRYRNLNDQIAQVRAEAKQAGEGSPAHHKLTDLSFRLSQEFPDSEEWLLATGFGNAIRAFEVYPRVMYGIEAIQGWSRLLTVVPKDYREVISSAEAETSMWANLWLLSLLVVPEYLVFALATGRHPYAWVPLLMLACALLAASQAKHAAMAWGEIVKASFDVYLPALGAKLGYDIPPDHEGAYSFWQNFSTAIIYRRRKSLLHLPSKKPSEPPEG